MTLYNRIFVINLRRALKEQRLSRRELSELSGVSPSFLFDMVSGKSNPSLKTMEAIANVLGVPLESLLSRASIDAKELEGLETPKSPSIPRGYTSVFAILPEHQAFLVRKWARRSAQKILAPEKTPEKTKQ